MKSMLAALVLIAAPQDHPAADLDAVTAAPGNHRVILENDQVRVLRVEVAPGETEPVHEHRWPSVMLIEAAQPALDIRYERRNGRLVETGRRNLPGGRPPPALYFPPEGPHAVRNLGSEPFRLVRVEMKQVTIAPSAPPQVRSPR